MLDTHLPRAAHLGTPEAAWQRPRTAIERAHHPLAGAHTRVGAEYDAAAALLDRRVGLLDYFREMAAVAAQLGACDWARARARHRDRDCPQARTLSGSVEFGERHAHASCPRRIHDVGALRVRPLPTDQRLKAAVVLLRVWPTCQTVTASVSASGPFMNVYAPAARVSRVSRWPTRRPSKRAPSRNTLDMFSGPPCSYPQIAMAPRRSISECGGS